jgi:hypothetical protein
MNVVGRVGCARRTGARSCSCRGLRNGETGAAGVGRPSPASAEGRSAGRRSRRARAATTPKSRSVGAGHARWLARSEAPAPRRPASGRQASSGVDLGLVLLITSSLIFRLPTRSDAQGRWLASGPRWIASKHDARLVEESATAARRLCDRAARLSQGVAGFRVGGRPRRLGQAAEAHRRRDRARPLARHAAACIPGDESPVRAAGVEWRKSYVV